jgi:hypothetical protein
MDEHEPVQDDEFVYRRIHRSFFNGNIPIPISRGAFCPNHHDITGLSVFRARFVNPVDTLANVEACKRNDYYIARLAVRGLHQLGLSFVAEPEVLGPPGHAVIPELSWLSYQTEKQRLKVIQLDLAKLASADIVHVPN